MKKIKYLILGVIAFCIFGAMNVKASGIVIKGNSVFRKSATEASISFISNTSGYIYYLINENSSASIEEFPSEANGGDITMNETKTIDIPSNLLSSGAKYAHIVVKDNADTFSNILTISMPKNVYYFDDFEAYSINLYPSFFTIKSNGGNSNEQKVISSNSNQVFNVYGTYGRGLDERIQINPLSTGYAILEADISASSTPNDYYFGGIAIGSNYDTYDRNIIAQVNNSNNKFCFSSCSAGNTSDKVFEPGKNYHVKIVVDVANDKYDYYNNGIKVNSAPINAIAYDQLTWFGIYNGDGTIQYDNIKFYTQETNPIGYSITKGSETNGTFTIDKSMAEKDENITITPFPAEGYRVKSVKINNSASGITKTLTNYTFTMPEENVLVTVEFEKIQFTITANSVTGATIDPNGTIIVEYNSNKEITITANAGYRLTSVKVNNVEQLPLTNNKIVLTNILENKTVIVTTKKIEYEVTDGNGQKHTIGKIEDSVFKIDADNSLFDKVYLNNEELNREHYLVTEGSTIITLKKDYLNTLLAGTYNLKATFTDGGEANATFVIAKSAENNPQTGDSIIISMIIGGISLLGLLALGIYKRKNMQSI